MALFYRILGMFFEMLLKLRGLVVHILHISLLINRSYGGFMSSFCIYACNCMRVNLSLGLPLL